MVNASMYDVYHNWLKSVQPGERPNLVITGSATVSSVYVCVSTYVCESVCANA